MELPKRKPIRLPDYDDSAPGAYFVTICTKDRKMHPLKPHRRGRRPRRPASSVDGYRAGRRGAHGRAPTVSDAVGALKRLVNRRIGHDIWQRSFHEHVIRNEQDYREIWEYIDQTPVKWVEDRYYEQ